jgi:hypothetical protein
MTAMLKPAAVRRWRGRRVTLRLAAADHRSFGRFIEAAQRRRAAGDYACFAVVPHNRTAFTSRLSAFSLSDSR